MTEIRINGKRDQNGCMQKICAALITMANIKKKLKLKSIT